MTVIVRKRMRPSKPIRPELNGGGVYRRILFGAENKAVGALLQYYLPDKSNEPNPKHGIYRELGDMVLTFVKQPVEPGQIATLVVNVQQAEHVAYHADAYYRPGSQPHIPNIKEAKESLVRLGETQPDKYQATFGQLFEAGVDILHVIAQTATRNSINL